MQRSRVLERETDRIYALTGLTSHDTRVTRERNARRRPTLRRTPGEKAERPKRNGRDETVDARRAVRVPSGATAGEHLEQLQLLLAGPVWL